MVELISDETVLEVIDKGLSALGESPKQALWHCLENDFKLDREKVPAHLEVFEQYLQNFFGLGYRFLNSLFKNYLGEATGENFAGCQSFSDCVNWLRSKNSTN
jgi:hypothetical protein